MKRTKHISINPVLTAVHGNINAIDQDGHLITLRFRETRWGTKYIGLGGNRKRDTEGHPYSEAERRQHAAFAAATAVRRHICQTPSLKAVWMAHFEAAQQSGTTKATTICGYIQSMVLHGRATPEYLPLE